GGDEEAGQADEQVDDAEDQGDETVGRVGEAGTCRTAGGHVVPPCARCSAGWRERSAQALAARSSRCRRLAPRSANLPDLATRATGRRIAVPKTAGRPSRTGRSAAPRRPA